MCRLCIYVWVRSTRACPHARPHPAGRPRAGTLQSAQRLERTETRPKSHGQDGRHGARVPGPVFFPPACAPAPGAPRVGGAERASPFTQHTPCLWVPTGVRKQSRALGQVETAAQTAPTCAGRAPPSASLAAMLARGRAGAQAKERHGVGSLPPGAAPTTEWVSAQVTGGPLRTGVAQPWAPTPSSGRISNTHFTCVGC